MSKISDKKRGRPFKAAGRRVGRKSYILYEDQQHLSPDFVRAAVDLAMECDKLGNGHEVVVRSRVSEDGGPDYFTIKNLSL